MNPAKNFKTPIQEGIVLIADRTYKSCYETDITSDELEMISDEYFESIHSALKEISYKTTHYQSPSELIDNVSKHRNDLVITIYGGSVSRNRMSLVPAVCESYKIKFVGADAYARIVCQDKYLSKQFAKRFNIPVPDSILVDKYTDRSLIKSLTFPLVVKPNLEGSSIGVSESSKVENYTETVYIIDELFKKFNQPILVEEFIPGREICICVVGNQKAIKLFEVMEVVFLEDHSFLYERLYTAKEKHLSEKTIKHNKITDYLSQQQKKDILSMFSSLGKMDFMRIDGRISNGSFTLIELTPDGYIGKDSSFADAAKTRNIPYNDLLKEIICTALDYYQTPYSNYIKS